MFVQGVLLTAGDLAWKIRFFSLSIILIHMKLFTDSVGGTLSGYLFLNNNFE